MLNMTARKWLKGLHVSLVGLCLGGTAAILVVQYMKYCLGDEMDHLTAEMSLYYLWNWAVVYPFAGIVVTGLVYSLATDWGFVRFRWVTVKWFAVLALAALNWIWLGPGVGGMAALADGYFSIEGALDLYKVMFRQATAAAAAQVFIMAAVVFLTVFKPWGARPGPGPKHRGLTVASVLILGLAGVGLLTANVLSLRAYRSMEISHVSPDSLADGKYRGEAGDGSYTYTVEVTVSGGIITSVRTLEGRDSLYVRYAEGVYSRVMNMQSPSVDAITGATTTSKVLLKAVERAMGEPPLGAVERDDPVLRDKR